MRKKKIESDSDMPSGNLTAGPDFLPPPSELAKAKNRVIMTIGLDQDIVEFFRQEARKNGTKYQRMINHLLRQYVDHHKKKAA